MPPWRLRRYVGPFHDPEAYARTGRLQVDGLRSLSVLTPSSRVLDVGCGTGRIAAALSDVVAPPGRYVGVDPQPEPIRWCQEHLTRGQPRFEFLETGTFSPKYNPRGGATPESYRLPFDSATFDLILLLSVLTHVGRATEANLLREIRRVLAPGGHVVLTAYLLDERTRPAAEAGRTVPQFPYALGEDRTQTPDSPEGFVARDAAWARRGWEAAGFSERRFHPGTWAGVADAQSAFAVRFAFYQDTVVLERTSPSTTGAAP